MAAKEPEDQRPRAPVSPGSSLQPTTADDPALSDRKPLFRDEPLLRDEVPSERHSAPGATSSTGAGEALDESSAGDETRVRSATPATTTTTTTTTPTTLTSASATTAGPLPAREGEGATQILPRTRRANSTSEFDDDLDAVPADRAPTRHRARLAMLIAGVVAVVVIGLAVGYSVLNLPDRPVPSSSNPSVPGGTPAPSDPAGEDLDVLLGDASMLTAAQATALAPTRTWNVASTQRGLDESSPQPACLAPDTLVDRPEPQQTILRLLSSSGAAAPGVLHQADAYAEPQEAARAYGAAAKALGGCSMTGAFLESGANVAGLGDQAAAAVVNVSADGKTNLRTVVVNRTGRVVNVLDVAQNGKAVALATVASALGAVTNAQCQDAGGRCSSAVAVQDGPPPPGGDQPGFLAAGDIPPVGTISTGWAGTVPTLPSPDFVGSGCETVTWAKVAARQRAARTYLLTDGNPKFGLDNLVVTHAGDAAAQALVGKVKADLDSCARRKLTATVSRPQSVTGVGAGSARVQGWTAAVSQKTAAGTARYRVGVVSARNKTVFLFLNPQQSLDLSDTHWNLVTVRAGQRASQVK